MVVYVSRLVSILLILTDTASARYVLKPLKTKGFFLF